MIKKNYGYKDNFSDDSDKKPVIENPDNNNPPESWEDEADLLQKNMPDIISEKSAFDQECFLKQIQQDMKEIETIQNTKLVFDLVAVNHPLLKAIQKDSLLEFNLVYNFIKNNYGPGSEWSRRLRCEIGNEITLKDFMQSREKRSLLMLSIICDSIRIFEFLLNKDFELVNLVDRRGYNILDISIKYKRENFENMIRKLCPHLTTKPLTIVFSENCAAVDELLYLALINNDLNSFKALSCNIDITNKLFINNSNALQVSVIHDSYHVVEYLIDKYPNLLNIPTFQHNLSIFVLAISQKSIKSLALLYDYLVNNREIIPPVPLNLINMKNKELLPVLDFIVDKNLKLDLSIRYLSFFVSQMTVLRFLNLITNHRYFTYLINQINENVNIEYKKTIIDFFNDIKSTPPCCGLYKKLDPTVLFQYDRTLKNKIDASLKNVKKDAAAEDDIIKIFDLINRRIDEIISYNLDDLLLFPHTVSYLYQEIRWYILKLNDFKKIDNVNANLKLGDFNKHMNFVLDRILASAVFHSKNIPAIHEFSVVPDVSNVKILKDEIAFLKKYHAKFEERAVSEDKEIKGKLESLRHVHDFSLTASDADAFDLIVLNFVFISRQLEYYKNNYTTFYPLLLRDLTIDLKRPLRLKIDRDEVPSLSEWFEPEYLSNCLRVSKDKLTNLSPDEYVKTLIEYSRFGSSLKTSGWLEQFINKTKDIISSLSPQHLSDIIFYLSDLNVKLPVDWIDNYLKLTINKLRELNSSELVVIFYNLILLEAFDKNSNDKAFCKIQNEWVEQFFDKISRSFHLLKPFEKHQIIRGSNFLKCLGYNINLPKLEIELVTAIRENEGASLSLSNFESDVLYHVKEQYLNEGVSSGYWVDELLSSVDIYVKNLNLIIEVDGPHHYQHESSDLYTHKTKFQTKMLEMLGYNLIRIGYKEWYQAKDEAIFLTEKIERFLKKRDNKFRPNVGS